MPRTVIDKKYVILIADYYIAYKSHTNQEVINVTRKERVLRLVRSPYGISAYILAENRAQFKSKSLEMLCAMLSVEHPTTTSYHPQRNEQVERYNHTIVKRLRHYVAGNQKDWETYMHRLIYASNAQVCKSTNRTIFSLVCFCGTCLDQYWFPNRVC